MVLTGAARLCQGYRIKGRFLVFVFFLLLDGPTQVYAGIFAGAIVGTYLIHHAVLGDVLWYALAGGALLGLGFILLRLVRPAVRVSLILVVGTALAVALYWWLGPGGEPGGPEALPTGVPRPVLKDPAVRHPVCCSGCRSFTC